MAEGISAFLAIIKNIRRNSYIYDERSTFRTTAFKHHHSHRHPTPGMLTHLDETETLTAAMPSPPPDRDAERALVDRARRGDVGAFEALYRANVGRVYALALRLTADQRDATELTQDVFVHAWRRLATFRGDAALATWLHRIAVNALFMRERGDRRRAARIQSVGEEPAGEQQSTSIDEGRARAVDVEQAVDLERAIAALPPGARRVFVLHDVIGYRHDEIAQLTGLAEGTLRAQLHRARKLLMEALDK
jgi:RNA polymerase sigma-70 factor (ECF subfamily)